MAVTLAEFSALHASAVLAGSWLNALPHTERDRTHVQYLGNAINGFTELNVMFCLVLKVDFGCTPLQFGPPHNMKRLYFFSWFHARYMERITALRGATWLTRRSGHKLESVQVGQRNAAPLIQ